MHKLFSKAFILAACTLIAFPAFAQESRWSEGRLLQETSPFEGQNQKQSTADDRIDGEGKHSKGSAWAPKPLGGDCNSCAGSFSTPEFSASPERLRGIWAYPDCGEPGGTLYVSEYFSSWIEEQSTICTEIFWASESFGQTHILELTSGKTIARLTNDGLMQTGTYDTQNPPSEDLLKDQDSDFHDLISFEGREYASCAAYPLPPHEKIDHVKSFLKDMDRIINRCKSEDNTLPLPENKKCTQTLFSEIDQNDNKSVSRQELERAVYHAMLLHELLVNCASVRGFQRRHMKDVIGVSDVLLTRLDRDRSFSLSYEELSQIQSEEDLHTSVRADFIVLQELLPFLRLK